MNSGMPMMRNTGGMDRATPSTIITNPRIRTTARPITSTSFPTTRNGKAMTLKRNSMASSVYQPAKCVDSPVEQACLCEQPIIRYEVTRSTNSFEESSYGQIR